MEFRLVNVRLHCFATVSGDDSIVQFSVTGVVRARRQRRPRRVVLIEDLHPGPTRGGGLGNLPVGQENADLTRALN